MIDKVATGSYFTDMRTVGIKLLKNKLSEYVRIAAGGEVVQVTDRDRIVAELVPPQSERERAVSDPVIAAGTREGWLAPASISPGKALPQRRPVAPLERIMRERDEDRADR